MTISLKHLKTSTIPDSGNTDLVQPSDWNQEHTLTCSTGTIIGRSTAGTGSAEEISIGSGLSLSGGTLTSTGSGGTVTSVTATTPISSSGGTTPNLSITQATSASDGYLSQTDWNTFNSKGSVTSVSGAGTVSGITLTSSGTSNVTLTLGGSLDLSSPPAIGSTTPSGGTFTTLTATSGSFQAAGASAGLTMLRNTDAASASTRIFLDSSGGTSTIYNNGGNNITFLTSATPGTSSGAQQCRVSHTASAVNYVQVTGNATTLQPTISTQGSDGNIALGIQTKGSGAISFYSQGGTSSRQFRIDATNTAVNYLQVQGTATTVAPNLSAQGSDTDIDIALTPKNAGNVRFGTYAASVLAVTGYITIKDSGGTTRRLLVG